MKSQIEYRRSSDFWRCRSCAQFDRFSRPEELKKLSSAQKKHYQDNPDRIETQRRATLKRYEDPEERVKQSESQKKYYRTHPERAKRHSEFMMGFKHTDESKLKMSSVQTGVSMSEIAKERLSATHQNIPYDEWNGFIKFKPYCDKFNESCRERNRNKHGRTCFICGMAERSNGRKLSVHHVDMNKDQGCDDHEWSLIPLCTSCHGKAHNPAWQARIEYLIEHVWYPDGVWTPDALC